MTVAFWDHNPDKITIGVEQERFLHSPLTGTPMPEVIMRQMFGRLSSGNSFDCTYEAPIPQIKVHSAMGDIRVDCDGYPHIIEVAYVQTLDANVARAVNSRATAVLAGWSPAEKMGLKGRNIRKGLDAPEEGQIAI